jgi:hypothetical protein
MRDKSTIPPSIYFGGACCGVSFYYGVVRAMKETWGEDFHTKTLVCGDSIGSIVALQLVIGYTPEKMEMISRIVFSKMGEDSFHSHGQNYWLDQYIDRLLEQEKTLYLDVQGKFRCGTTRAHFEHQWHEKWTDNEDLRRCLKGSCNVPLYCGRCEKVNGEEVIDGALSLTGSQFPHGDETLFVGANQPSAEINYNLTYWETAVPNLVTFNLLLKEGYSAFKEWDGEYKEKVAGRNPDNVAIVVLWMGKYLQMLYGYFF